VYVFPVSPLVGPVIVGFSGGLLALVSIIMGMVVAIRMAINMVNIFLIFNHQSQK
jgi:hypothetical protein